VNVCVFCASNQPVAPAHRAVARELGAWIGARGHGLVWGGCNVGLMDEIGRARCRRIRDQEKASSVQKGLSTSS